jgi:hypothetical protein
MHETMIAETQQQRGNCVKADANSILNSASNITISKAHFSSLKTIQCTCNPCYTLLFVNKNSEKQTSGIYLYDKLMSSQGTRVTTNKTFSLKAS